MGWKTGLAGLALAAGLAGAACSAEPGASYETFEGRDYLLLWPAVPPSAVMIYLHVADAQPLAYEASSGMLEALAADSALRGYAVVAPTAALNACGLAEDAPQRFCWQVDAVGEELGRVDRLLSFLERNNEVAFSDKMMVGYGRGGDFISAAVAERRLDGFQKVGLIDAGPPPASTSMIGAAATGPLIYLEAAEGDQVSAARARDLLTVLVNAGYGLKTCAHGDLGGAFYDTRRLAAFLAWFAVDCRAAQPQPTAEPVQPAAPPPVLQTEPIAAVGDDEMPVEEGEQRAESAQPVRSGPRP